MIRSTRCRLTYAALLAGTLFGAPVFAQAPTDAQRAAIRSECRSDYEAHCASIPPGGAASLQCLQKNMASLSAGCAGAVRAVGSPTESSAEPKAAPSAEPKPAQSAAPAPAAATTAPAEPAAKPANTAPAATVLVLRPLRPREVLFVMRSACGSDVRALCPGVEAGGGRIAQCLASHAASLSPACRTVLAQFAAR